jgi:hypothetical protein
MITQPGWRKGVVLKKFVIQAHPIIQTYIQKLKIAELIGSYIQQDHRIKLPVEQTLCVLIHNILTTPMPMYEIAAWMAPLDENCLGLDPSEAQRIQDDRVGQALERFYRGRHKDVFFHLALRAIKVFQLQCSQIHQDTTTVTFAGKYAGWDVPELLTHGVNKDHRPDLKQLVLGLSVTADGAVPLVHKIYDGNQTDDRLHPENHQRLRQLLKGSDFIYVADCKLATADNLHRISSCGGRFVSVMPRTWKEDAHFRQCVREGKVQWTHLLPPALDQKHSESRAGCSKPSPVPGQGLGSPQRTSGPFEHLSVQEPTSDRSGHRKDSPGKSNSRLDWDSDPGASSLPNSLSPTGPTHCLAESNAELELSLFSSLWRQRGGDQAPSADRRRLPHDHQPG